MLECLIANIYTRLTWYWGFVSIGKHSDRQALGAYQVVVVVVVVVVVDFDYAVVHSHGRGKRLGACLMVKPCVSCVMNLQHISMFDYAGGAQA